VTAQARTHTLLILLLKLFAQHTGICPYKARNARQKPTKKWDNINRLTVETALQYYLPTYLPKLHGTESFLRSYYSLSQKFPSFYGTRGFITVFTTACHWSLSWARWIQSTPSHPMTFQYKCQASNSVLIASYLLLEVNLDTDDIGVSAHTQLKHEFCEMKRILWQSSAVLTSLLVLLAEQTHSTLTPPGHSNKRMQERGILFH
jgi:hypothetical protein